MLLSVITAMLYAVVTTSNISHYELKIGGLNETELLDLNQTALPYPFNSAVELAGVWTATYRMSEFLFSNLRISDPPVHLVAPFLSRMKSWGFKITFFNTYAGDIQSFSNSITTQRTALLSYTWVLERDSEFRYISPPPTNPPEDDVMT